MKKILFRIVSCSFVNSGSKFEVSVALLVTGMKVGLVFFLKSLSLYYNIIPKNEFYRNSDLILFVVLSYKISFRKDSSYNPTMTFYVKRSFAEGSDLALI